MSRVPQHTETVIYLNHRAFRILLFGDATVLTTMVAPVLMKVLKGMGGERISLLEWR